MNLAARAPELPARRSPRKGKSVPDRREDSERSERGSMGGNRSRPRGRVLRFPALLCPACAQELVPFRRCWRCEACGVVTAAPVRPEWERAVAGLRGLFA